MQRRFRASMDELEACMPSLFAFQCQVLEVTFTEAEYQFAE